MQQGLVSQLRKPASAVLARVRRLQQRRLLQSGGAPADYYDEIYSGSDEYATHYAQSVYAPLWEAICSKLRPQARVLEVGCGPAQLARMMFDRDLLGSYVGFDFSPTAIDLARKLLPGVRLEVADGRTTDLFTTVDYDTVICTEVFEHVADDLLVLRRVPEGVHVLATVPDFYDPSHVRWFKDAGEVRERYGSSFTELEVTTHDLGQDGTFFLLSGRR